ncbi:MAG: type VI secretion system-associated FHA domain protein TagH [Caulobacteraceae bacterium]
MFTLRLFRSGNPGAEIESRRLTSGEIVVGRDPEASWSIEDPSLTISRRHCVLAVEENRLVLKDTSANGVFIGERRAPAGTATRIDPGEALRLGDFIILAERAPPAAGRRNRRGVAPVAGAPREAPAIHADAALFDAFCRGAGLEVSAFSAEDPAELMRQLGQVYREMITGLGALMSERTAIKSDYRMDRTSVRAMGNNPFRWAPASRVAIDVLKGREEGFLTGARAVKASFEDLKLHMVCTLAGMRAALAQAIDGLSPPAVEQRMQGRSFVLKNKAAAYWGEYVALHAALAGAAAEDSRGEVNARFRAAYEEKLLELEAMDGGS